MESTSLYLGATSASERISNLNRESRNNLLDRIELSEAHLDLEYQQQQRQQQLVNHISCYDSRIDFTPDQDNEFLHEQRQQSIVLNNNNNNKNNVSHNLQRGYFSVSLDSLTNLITQDEVHTSYLVGKQSLSQERFLYNSDNNNNKAYRIIKSPELSSTGHQLLEFQYNCLEAEREDSKASACVSMPSLERNHFLDEEEKKQFGNFREEATTTTTTTRRQIALNVNSERFDDDEEEFLLSPIANSPFSSRSSPPLFDLNCATTATAATTTNLNDVMSSDLCLDIVAPTINKVNEKAVKQNYVPASYNNSNNNRSSSNKVEHQDNIRKQQDDQDMLVEYARQTGDGMFWLSFRDDQDELRSHLRAKPAPAAVSNEVPPEQQQRQHYNRLLITDCFSGNHSGSRVGGSGLDGGGRIVDDDRLVLGARCAQSECNLSSGHSSSAFDSTLNYQLRDRRLVSGNDGAKIRIASNNNQTQQQQQTHNLCSNRVASFVEQNQQQQAFINAPGNDSTFAANGAAVTSECWSTTTRELFSNPSSSSSANQYSQYSSNSNICNADQKQSATVVGWQKGANQQLWRLTKLPPQSSNVSSYLNLNKYNNAAASLTQTRMFSSEFAPHANTLEAGGSSYLADPNLPNSINKDWTINNTNQVCVENYSDLAAAPQPSYSLSKPTFPSQLKQQHQQQQQHLRLHQYQDRLQQIPASLEPRCYSAMSVPCDSSPFDGAALSSNQAMPTFHTPFHRNSLATDSNQYQWRPQSLSQQMQLQLNMRYQHQQQRQQQQQQQQQSYRNFQQHRDRNESPNFIENCARSAAQTSSLNELTNVQAISSLTSSPIAYDKLVAFNGNVGGQVSVVEHSKRQQQQQQQQHLHNHQPQQQASHFPSPTQNHRSRGHRRRYHRSQSPHHNHHHRHHQQTQQQHYHQQQQEQHQQHLHRQHRRRSRYIQLKDKSLTRFATPSEDEDGDDDEEDSNNAQEVEDDDESDSGLSLVTAQAEGRLPMSIAEQMKEQASNFVNQYGSNNGGKERGKRRANRKPNLQVRRTLRVKIKKSKPILGIAIEGGFNVSGQLLPRIVCVHEDGAAYQCGKLRASDLILEVNGKSTVNMTHDEIAKTIATAYYQDPRSHIEFLIGESIQV